MPVQPLQKRSRSTLVSLPVTAGVNVWPAQLVAGETEAVGGHRQCSAGRRRPHSTASRRRGCSVRSQLVGTPVWKSACVVSVRQPLGGAALSAKFRVVDRAVGHDDAGERRRVEAGEAGRDARVRAGGKAGERVVAAGIGGRRPAAERHGRAGDRSARRRSVTVPCSVPLPIGVHDGNANEPMRVRSFKPVDLRSTRSCTRTCSRRGRASWRCSRPSGCSCAAAVARLRAGPLRSATVSVWVIVFTGSAASRPAYWIAGFSRRARRAVADRHVARAIDRRRSA